jgi:crotonobetainyl-CoA:carnitine CoA-transferase CaiB-like acyl-CoA transferase
MPFMDTLRSLWTLANLPAATLGQMALTGKDPVLPSGFAVGTAAQASIAACTLAAALLHGMRGGPAQRASVDMRHAAIEFRSERHLRVDGVAAASLWDPLAGLYPCADGFVRLHTNFPHHREGVLSILGCDPTREAVARALLDWPAEAFESVAAKIGIVGAAARRFEEWDQHPQALALASQPPFTLERIGDAPPIPLPPLADRPLAGLRVLDLTRVIAGPVAARTLAAHGAEVLHIAAPHLPSMGPLVLDTGRGKRSAFLDLRDADARAKLEGLVRGADIFLQGYRPGGIAGLGFGPERLASLRPGIIALSLSAYGHLGPWSGRRGFDSLTQTATGINWSEADTFGEAVPRALPCQVLDHASGYMLAFGAMAALARRAEEGGSWHVRVSLAATGQWLRSLGQVRGGAATPDPRHEDVADLLEDSDSGFGRLTTIRHAGILETTPAHWALPSVPLGTHPAAWA